MPLIKIQRVPGMAKEIHRERAGVLLSDVLSSKNLSADIRVIYNKKKIADDDDVDFVLNDGDEVVIFDQPFGGDLVKTLFSPLKIPIKLTQKIFSQLIKQPSIGASKSKTSANNNLKEQTNLARNGEARPDNYGQIRAYPDLIQRSVVEYVNNVKFVTEYMDIGIGSYDVSQVRYSETTIGAMAGSSYQVFQPGENIGNIIQPYPFDDVDGNEIPGKNQNTGVIIETATTNTVTSSAYSGGQLQVVIPKDSDFDYFMQIGYPRAISFVVNVTYSIPSGPVTQNVSLFGNLIAGVETNDGATPTPNYFYTFTINDINGTGAGSVFNGTINNTLFTLNDNQPLVIGPFFSPVESSSLWIHTQSQLQGSDATNWVLTLWKVDDDNLIIPGTTETFTYHQSNPDDDVSQTWFRTDKITPLSGPGRFAVSLYRPDNVTSSKLILESITAINVRQNVSYPLDTIIMVKAQSSKNSSSNRERKYNALITRKTISYVNGAVDMTLRASRSFADAVLHTWLVMGNQNIAVLDVASLYEISDSLPDVRLGYFDYTFDDEDFALGERIQTICDAARVIAYWDDGILSFVRDEKRDYPATVFNTANTSQGDYSLSYDMTLPGGFDGVRVQYKSPVTNKQAYIYYKVDGDSVIEGQPVKPKKIDMLYVRNDYQARDRAILECRKLIYSRQSMNIKALGDGEWVNVGDMIQVIDMYDINQQSGKITGRNGNIFTTSEEVTFSGNMYVVVTDRNGNVTSRYPAYAVAGNTKSFSANIPLIDLAIWNGSDVQSPSRYAIATQEELDRTLWTITAKNPGTDGTTGVTVSEYQEAMYTYTI